MIALLDTNVLIALLDPAHTFHAIAASWFRDHAADGWATCPITENGFVRIVSHSSYPQPITVADAVEIMRCACSHAAHSFWPDNITVIDNTIINDAHLLTSGQVTDTYLLGLAIHHDGYLVTLDRRIDVAAIRGASSSRLIVIKPGAF
ncbi:MAG: PIN domain-containing protein [Propionibacteriaceae bacterium]|nr:PIN domain-containing protein [Propionibacteriaceae bacterium]